LEIQYYKNFEEKELDFNEKIGSLLPRKHSGINIFWDDFLAAISSVSDKIDNPISYISSNPRECLAYNYVDDILNAAKMIASISNAEFKQIIKKYNIEPLLGQKTYSLSGGEVTSLAFVKNDLLSSVSNSLVMSSPSVWLSSSNKALYNKLVDSYKNKGKEIHVLAMEEEYDNAKSSLNIERKIEFYLSLEQIKIDLTSASYDNQEPEYATIEDFKDHLISPCFIVGDNGSGKSLFAKVLSGTIKYTGKMNISSNGYIGGARLMFQDIIMQSLLRPFDILAKFDTCESNKEIKAIYNTLIDKFRTTFDEKGEIVPYIGRRNSNEKTLLEYKFMITAIRICSKPTGLILDEPSWGLTKRVTVAFVEAIINISHSNKIPVFIISHKEWWDLKDFSHILLKKNSINKNGIKYNFILKHTCQNQQRRYNEMDL